MNRVKTYALPLLAFFGVVPSAFAAGGFTWFGTLQHYTNVPAHVSTLAFVGIVLCAIALVYRSSLAKVKNVVIPDGRPSVRGFVEVFGQFIYEQCKAILGEKEAPKYFSFVATIFIVILFCNLVGMIPGFGPPTDTLNTTLALGVFSFVYYNIKGCKELGVVNYIKHFLGPLWYLAVLIFPIEIISNMVRPISLALRLQGNMSGDHQVVAIASNLIPGLIPIFPMVLGLIVCFIQAYVFTMLSMVYINLATAHHDHDEHH